MKRILLLQLFLFTAFGFAQVGVNTTTPDPSSMLDVSATNKGALFPRVSLSNINLTTLDGTNTAAIGLLIWNNNPATIGGNGVGYYFFNGTIWVPVFQSNQTIDVFSLTGSTLNLSLQNDGMATQTLDLSSLLGDDDWTDVGVDIERQAGNVYIGDTSGTNNNLYISNQIIDWDNVTYTIDPNGDSVMNEIQFDNGTIADPSIRFSEANTGFFSPTTDVFAYSANGTEAFRIHPNGNMAVGQTVDTNFKVSVSSSAGLNNVRIGNNNNTDNVVEIDHNSDTQNSLEVNSNSAYTLASRSAISANNSYVDTAVDISRYEIGANASYGIKSINSNSFGIFSGSHYGIYSEALQTNGYAGYFLGKMSIGTTAVNNYILPPSRGTNGQFMQTDGVGNVSWVNASAIDTDDQTTDVFSLTGTTLNLSLQNDGVATQTVDLSSLRDHDWYEVGTTNSPNDINDNIFKQGSVTIGSNVGATGVLDIDNSTRARSLDINNTFATNPIGINILMNSTASGKNGISIAQTGNTIGVGDTSNMISSSDTANGNHNRVFMFNSMNGTATDSSIYSMGIFNSLGGSGFVGPMYGMYNQDGTSSNGERYGMNNTFIGSGFGNNYGQYNIFAGTGQGEKYGLFNLVTNTGAGDKYGVYNQINPTSGGTHYGIYSNVTKANSYAGYFLGNVSIGTTTLNMYTLPPSRGTNGQIIQTNAVGNATWVNPPIDTDDQTTDIFSLTGTTLNLSLQNDGVATQTVDLSSLNDHDWYEIGTTTAPNAITDNIYTQGKASIGSSTLSNGKFNVYNSAETYSLYAENSFSPAGNTYTAYLTNSGTGANQRYGLLTDVSGAGSGMRYGIFNTNNSTSTGNQGGVYNFLTGSGGDFIYGLRNYITATGSGAQQQFGVYNDLSTVSDSQIMGVYNFNPSNGNGIHYGTHNRILGNGNGVKYGTYNFIMGTGTGMRYGNYNYITGNGTNNKYGTYNLIDPLAAGTHFGLYSEALKTGSYAGYFLGDVSVGTTTANTYVLPPSRGTNGQIMQTNGTGVVTWVNPGAAESTTANNGLTETVNNVQLGGALVQNTTLTNGTFNMDVNLNSTGDFSIQDNGTDVLFVEDTGEIGIGTNVPAYPLHMIENGAVDNAFFLDKTETSANNTSGIFINKTGQGTGRSHAIFTDVDGTGTGQKYGVFNQISSTAAGNQYGTRNFISGSSPSSQFGTFNNLDNAGTGIHYGNYNGMRGTSAATLYANYNEFDNVTTAANSYGNYTSFSANATGTGDKYGTYNTINTAIPGIHYGTFNSVGVANGWAGYFLGKNYISDREAIGETDNPNAGLSINKNSTGTYSHIELKETTANDGARLTFSNTAEVTNNWLLYGRADNTITDSRFNIFHTTTGNIMQITGDGLVGILRAPTTNQLEINGTASKAAAGAFIANSDSRLKKNIATISPTEALEKVLSLRGVTYEWNDNKTGMNRPEGIQLGFVAQEIQQVFPEKVTEDKQGYLQTAYGDYDPIIFQAIKALSDKIDKLEKENEELKKRIEDKK